MSAAHEALVQALTVERYDQTWWREAFEDAPVGGPDTDINRARRRRVLDEAYQDDTADHANERPRLRMAEVLA